MPGNFLTVACPECDNEQIVFGNAATVVTCTECDAVLATPGGGEATIAGEVTDVVQAR